MKCKSDSDIRIDWDSVPYVSQRISNKIGRYIQMLEFMLSLISLDLPATLTDRDNIQKEINLNH
jgi:hypothetical protein